MHDALSVPRTHNPKNNIVGLYDPSNSTTVIEKPKGPMTKTMGNGDAQGRLNLLPEEALYLIERGTMDLRWRSEELEGIPLSLQAAYAYLLGNQGLTLERYTVYTSLKRIGYVVMRGPAWYESDYDKDLVRPRQLEKNTTPLGLFTRFYNSLFSTSQPDHLPIGSLVTPGLYRDYNTIYQLLSLIPTHDPSLPTDRESLRSSASMGHSTSPTHPRIRCCFHAWKPTNTHHFRKSAPPPPDFRIAVINAREEGFPVLEQLDDLLQSVPYNPPPVGSEGQLYRRVKHGWRNVVLAVVDQGVVSYLRVGDAGFGMNKVYEGSGRGRGGKRGGMRGGRGRGRGRGGGR
jgi:tRNA-splicing endonuclease subunit Sen54